MSAFKRWLILGIVSSALFLIVIDMTILYTALPILTLDLHASASEKLWIVNAYSLVMAGLLPAMGTLGDRIGYKQIFAAGIVLFGAASIVAAFSPSPGTLILARILLAVGASMMMPATLSIIKVTFSKPAELGVALGIWGSVSSGGAGLGPIIGGFLLEHFWWGSVFLINIPIAILAFIMTVVFIPKHSGDKTKKFDYVSSAQIMIALVTLIYAIKEFTRRDGSMAIAILSAVIGIIAIFIFIRRQNRMSTPLIDLSLFKNSTLTLGFFAALISSFALMGVQYLITQRLQLVEGMTPLQAGMYTLCMPIAAFIAGPIAGAMLNRIHVIYIKSAGFLIAAVGMGIYLLNFNSGHLSQILGLSLLGAGIGATMTTASHSIMSQAPSNKAGMVASIEEVAFELGGAVGIAIIGSLSGLFYTLSMNIAESLNLPLQIRDSLDEALIVAEGLPEGTANEVIAAGFDAFNAAFTTVNWGVTLLLALVAIAIARVGVTFEKSKQIRTQGH